MKENSKNPTEFRVYEKIGENYSIQFSEATVKEVTSNADLGIASASMSIPAGVISSEEEGRLHTNFLRF